MNPYRAIVLSLRTLSRNRLRTCFMMLGMVVGIASLTALSCAELSSSFGATLDAISNTCVSDGDCQRVGAPPAEPMCRCSVGIIVGCGSGANRAAYAASAGPALSAEFARRCAGAPGLTLTCACGNYVAHCGADGSCVAEEATACVP